MSRREALPLLALGFILAVSAAWWALALWPLPADAADWIQRTRAVCFGAAHDSLPSASGWVLLIGEPVTMLAALTVIWPRALRDGLAVLWRTTSGRAALTGTAGLILLGIAATAGRVAAQVRGESFDPTRPDVSGLERLDRPAPPLGLVDQHGRTVTINTLGGRPAIVTFAYGHCTTVCPVLVHEALEAQRRLAASAETVAVVVVTLDPWRDTPARLPMVARMWEMGDDALVLSGDTAAVASVLDAWNVPRSRDMATGDVTHGTPVWLVDRRGRLAFESPPWAESIVTLAERLR